MCRCFGIHPSFYSLPWRLKPFVSTRNFRFFSQFFSSSKTNGRHFPSLSVSTILPQPLSNCWTIPKRMKPSLTLKYFFTTHLVSILVFSLNYYYRLQIFPGLSHDSYENINRINRSIFYIEHKYIFYIFDMYILYQLCLVKKIRRYVGSPLPWPWKD